MSTDSPLPPDFHFYSVLVIGLSEGPLFVVLLVEEAPWYWHKKSGSCSKTKRVSAKLGGGLEEGWVNAGPAWAPEQQHLPRFTQSGLLASAVSLERRKSSTSGCSQQTSLLLLMWLLLCVLQSFWGPCRWSSTRRRRKVRTPGVACVVYLHFGHVFQVILQKKVL